MGIRTTTVPPASTSHTTGTRSTTANILTSTMRTVQARAVNTRKAQLLTRSRRTTISTRGE